MGQEALEAAIRHWRGEPPRPRSHESRLVCKCFAVTEEQIVKAIRENGLTSVEEVTNYTKAGGGCGDCHEDIAGILEAVLNRGTSPLRGGIADLRPPSPKGSRLSNIQRMQKVMTILEDVIRPRLLQDGGDIELVDIDGKVVTVALLGLCASCPSSRLTVEGFVQQTLRDAIEPDLIVKEATP
jgi:NifU-like protein